MESERVRYDLAFGMGFSCGASTALRAAGLQQASYPLDWIGSPGIVASARMIAANFSGWFEKDDLRLYDIRRGALNKHVYLNVRTGFGFPHDFSSFVGFDEAYPEIRARYDRRIARFLEVTGRAKRLLAVYVEFPVKGCSAESELEEARRILSARFPGAEVDVLYFHEGVGCREPIVRKPIPGITTVEVDYREMERGQIMHTVDHSRIAEYLAANVEVADTRTPEERAGYAERKAARRSVRWGKGGFLDRLLNRMAYRVYRKLEKRLVARGLVPWEGPLWFVRFDK